jgi:hypothetical protein
MQVVQVLPTAPLNPSCVGQGGQGCGTLSATIACWMPRSEASFDKRSTWERRIGNPTFLCRVEAYRKMCKLQMPYLGLSLLGISRNASAGLVHPQGTCCPSPALFALIGLSYCCWIYLLICRLRYTRLRSTRSLSAPIGQTMRRPILLQ